MAAKASAAEQRSDARALLHGLVAGTAEAILRPRPSCDTRATSQFLRHYVVRGIRSGEVPSRWPAHARAWLGESGAHASYTLLIDRVPPSLDEFAADGRFDLVLLPARRRPMRTPGHPAAERLRRATGAQIQVIAPQPQQRTRH